MSIKIENLTYVYMPKTPFEKKALDNVSLEIEDGEFLAVIGHTGSGKSTLIQHLNGLLKPASGKIYVDGTDITDKDTKLVDIRKKVGLVFQYPEYQLFEETIAKDIAYGPTNLGLNEDEILRRVKKSMKMVGLDYDEYKDISPFELSGGQKRRVAIAGVIAMEPNVLILDEPTAGLDPISTRAIVDIIKGLNDSKKIPKSKHEAIYKQVMKEAVAVGIGIKDNHVIDDVNIYEATKLAMAEAIEKLSPEPEHLLIDAMTLDLPIGQTSIIKGDANSLSIAAASIVAKVTRDKMMADYDQEFPGYAFAKNAGYGTKDHLSGIDKFGVTPIHRRSFEPIKSIIKSR